MYSCSLACGLNFQGDHQYHFPAARETTGLRSGIPPTEEAMGSHRGALYQEEEIIIIYPLETEKETEWVVKGSRKHSWIGL